MLLRVKLLPCERLTARVCKFTFFIFISRFFSFSISLNKSSFLSATINFEHMTFKKGSDQAELRRLSTPSYNQEPGKALATKWIWYWKDDDGWKKYDVTEVRVCLFFLLDMRTRLKSHFG